MKHTLLVAMLLVVAACSTDTPSVGTVAGAGSVLPDTQTVDGVLVMRHDPAAFATAPQWRVADSAEVVFDGGDDPNLDLTYVSRPALMSDGSLIAVNEVNAGRVMHFPADGSSGRLISGQGEGPGDVMSPQPPVMVGDSALVWDDRTVRVNWYTAVGGWVGSTPLYPKAASDCLSPVGVVGAQQLLTVTRCWGNAVYEFPKGGGRVPTHVVAVAPDFAIIDTIGLVPGIELRWAETRFGGQRREFPMALRLPRLSHVQPWGSSIATSNDQHGYSIDRRALDGTVTGRLEVVMPRRVVTDAMRDAVIARELEMYSTPSAEAHEGIEESRRLARESPIADSLPPYAGLVVGVDGMLWIVDAFASPDTAWAATAYREDGEIVARLTGTGQSWPTQILDDRVLIRTTDADGVVRFEVRRIVKGDR